MANNRAWQNLFKTPLLLELAASEHWGVIYVDQGIGELLDILKERYHLPNQYTSRRLPGGERQFRNDVEWAKKQLVDHKHVTHVPRQNWGITDVGRIHLRDEIVQLLDRLDDPALESVLSDCDECHCELLISVLRKLPEEVFPRMLSSTENRRELFISAIGLLPPEYVADVALSLYEVIVDRIYDTSFRPFIKANYREPALSARAR